MASGLREFLSYGSLLLKNTKRSPFHGQLDVTAIYYMLEHVIHIVHDNLIFLTKDTNYMGHRLIIDTSFEGFRTASPGSCRAGGRPVHVQGMHDCEQCGSYQTGTPHVS